MKHNKIIVCFCMILIFLSTACSVNEEDNELFTAGPTEMLPVDGCGFDRKRLGEILNLHGVTVTVGEEVFSFDDIRTPEETADEGSGVWRLTAYDPGMDQFAGEGGFDDWIPDGDAAREIDSLLPASFPAETESAVSVVSSIIGIQMERSLPDGTEEVFFASPEGFVFTPADQAEYRDGEPEYLILADLPSGFRYAPFSGENFARLAAWEAAFSGKQFEKEVGFAAYGIPPEEAAGYRLCISSADRHLDLSLSQAKEFLKDRLGYKEGARYAHFALDPAERPVPEDVIKLTEYSSDGEIETTCYLAPSGKLFQMRGSLAAIDGNGYFAVTGFMAASTEESCSYDAVRDLLTEMGNENR